MAKKKFKAVERKSGRTHPAYFTPASINEKQKKEHAGRWEVTFSDGTSVHTGYHPNARMAVGEALAKHKGNIVKVTYV